MTTRVGILIAAIAPFLALLVLGCAANTASNRSTIPRANVVQCVSLCESAGLELQSLVIVANQTGCVCAPSNAQGARNAGATAAASGGAVAVAIAQSRQQQQQR